LPLCLAFIIQKKAFDTVESEAVIDALLTQEVPAQYIRVLRELYSGFATKISPFYNDVVIEVKRWIRQGMPYPQSSSAPPSKTSRAN
uniref:Annexin n=1 Tax=Heligmosomoides polygyrus TaxID=6339 RepID=A0A183GNC6_HELPZ